MCKTKKTKFDSQYFSKKVNKKQQHLFVQNKFHPQTFLL